MTSYSKGCKILTDAVPMTTDFAQRLQLYRQMIHHRWASAIVVESRKKFKKTMKNGLAIVNIEHPLTSSAEDTLKLTTLQAMNC